MPIPTGPALLAALALAARAQDPAPNPPGDRPEPPAHPEPEAVAPGSEVPA